MKPDLYPGAGYLFERWSKMKKFLSVIVSAAATILYAIIEAVVDD